MLKILQFRNPIPDVIALLLSLPLPPLHPSAAAASTAAAAARAAAAAAAAAAGGGACLCLKRSKYAFGIMNVIYLRRSSYLEFSMSWQSN